MSAALFVLSQNLRRELPKRAEPSATVPRETYMRECRLHAITRKCLREAHEDNAALRRPPAYLSDAGWAKLNMDRDILAGRSMPTAEAELTQ